MNRNTLFKMIAITVGIVFVIVYCFQYNNQNTEIPNVTEERAKVISIDNTDVIQ